MPFTMYDNLKGFLGGCALAWLAVHWYTSKVHEQELAREEDFARQRAVARWSEAQRVRQVLATQAEIALREVQRAQRVDLAQAAAARKRQNAERKRLAANDKAERERLAAIQHETSSVAMDDVTVISQEHGRQRRVERGISKSALKACVKYGKKTPIMMENGKLCWQFELKRIVYSACLCSRSLTHLTDALFPAGRSHGRKHAARDNKLPQVP